MTYPRSAGNNHETACFSYLQDCCDKLTFVLTLDCPGNLVLAPRPVSTRHPLREVPTLSLVSRRPPAVVPLYLANPAIRLVQPPAGECAADFSCLSTSRAAASSRICKAIFRTATLVSRCRSPSLVPGPRLFSSELALLAFQSRKGAGVLVAFAVVDSLTLFPNMSSRSTRCHEPRLPDRRRASHYRACSRGNSH